MDSDAEQLGRLQRWFQSAITHPNGVSGGLRSSLARQNLPKADATIDDIVLPSKALDAQQRLSIYANMYFDRLAEILAEEFPTVRYLLGHDVFAEAVTAYVTRHPSTSYNLTHLGKAFPHFLLEECEEIELPNRAFAAAVALVERTIEEVFDEQQDEPMSVEDVQKMMSKDLNRVRLEMISALRLLSVPYPVNNYISAVREGHSIEIPDAERSFIVVYRRDYRVWRKDVDKQQYSLLHEIIEKRTLAQALAACAEVRGSDTETLAASLQEWFRDWTAEGFLKREL